MSEHKKTVEVGGAKVTLNPSEQIVKVATKDVVVLDELGRSIRLKKPSPLANLDFTKAVGKGAGTGQSRAEVNLLYIATVDHLKYVAAIDDQVVVTPSTDGELRALYQRLGDEGNTAAQQGVADNFASTAEEVEADLKNS